MMLHEIVGRMPCFSGVAAALRRPTQAVEFRAAAGPPTLLLRPRRGEGSPSLDGSREEEWAAASPSPSPCLRSRGSASPCLRSPTTPHVWEEHVSDEVVQICKRISQDRRATVSAHELIAAVRQDNALACLVLPASELRGILASEERTADAVDAVFKEVAEGRHRIRMSDFAAYLDSQRYLRLCEKQEWRPGAESRRIFGLIDADRSGSISKLELFDAVRGKPEVAAYVLPGAGDQDEEEDVFDEVKQLFEAITGGKRRIELPDFQRHFRRRILTLADIPEPEPPSSAVDRSRARVMVLEAGFGPMANTGRTAVLEQAGYQLRWASLAPPELHASGTLTAPQLEGLRDQIADFQPDVVVAAAAGTACMAALWSAGWWAGPTVLIDVHPSCRSLPAGVPVVLAGGPRGWAPRQARAQLEALLATGSRSDCFLCPVAGLGAHVPGLPNLQVNAHGQDSLCSHDCMPRLIDAAMCPDGPEVHVLRSWRARLSHERQEAERQLGYGPERLRRRWRSPGGRGMDNQKLFEVPPASSEFRHVETAFLAPPREAPAYSDGAQEEWDRVRVVAVHRVENGAAFERSTKPYHDSLRKSVEDQGIEFEPGTHTCWAFHGADAATIQTIVSDPIAGFQPLAASGTSGGSAPWGSGTYFVRDARRLAAGGLCAPLAADGTRSVLMCMLSTGVPCLGDPQHRGVLPMRQTPHRYNCTVDSLSSPETYVLQHPGAAHAAYLITFATEGGPAEPPGP